MYKHFFVIIVFGSCALFMYGVLNVFLEVEENACRMTYMFGAPQFAPINLDADATNYPNYGLYYYYEGRHDLDANTLDYEGAPVLFIPGNGGSHKQVRSLASVALKKSMAIKNHIKLDYFTISYNEELSALYGGYLENQKAYLKLCIDAIFKLYHDSGNSARKIILVGHSMGGKIAESAVMDERIAHRVNSIIFIASPVDQPVLNMDASIAEFYNETNSYLARRRGPLEVAKNINACNNFILPPYDDKSSFNWNKTSSLENILFVTIGGGNRDLLVRSGLTTSRFSDIHAMTTSIPDVWLSCDHLASVWCLQLVKVITRFLFSISYRDDSNGMVFFKESKGNRLHSALHHFLKNQHRPKTGEFDFSRYDKENLWYEDSKKVFQRHFKFQARKTYNQMISLTKFNKYTKLYLELHNFDEDDWLYGCTAQHRADGQSFCEKGSSLAQYIQRSPDRDYAVRSFVMMDLQKLKNKFTKWTHVVVRVPSSSKPVSVHTDIHDPAERNVAIKMPRWFAFNKVSLFNETAQGTLYYKIEISELEEPFQGIQFNVDRVACIGESSNVLVKVCVPWASGFVRYYKINEKSKSDSIYVNVPLSIPSGYNTTVNPVTVEVFLDPQCRYSLSYQFSIVNTMSKLVQEYFQWLPAHLVAVLFIVLKNQLLRYNKEKGFKGFKPYKEYFQYSSIYILTGCRIFKKMLIPVKFLPPLDTLTHTSFFVSIVLHSAAICLSVVLAFAFWILLVWNGNIFLKVLSRFFKFSLEPSALVVNVISALPTSFGVLTVALAVSANSGVALICAATVYFLMISNAYKDYLENLLWTKSSAFLRKAFTKGSKKESGEEAKLTEKDGQQSKNDGERSENDGEQSDNDDEHPANALLHNEASENAKEEAETETRPDGECEGLQNFEFHITMLILLFIMSALNGTAAMAWFKTFRHSEKPLPDPSLLPTIVVLVSLTVLLQLKAPNKLVGHRCLSLILYACASICVIYCQKAIYRLNWLIAFTYALIALHELVNKIWMRCQRGQDSGAAAHN